jgi:hypothetical protein
VPSDKPLKSDPFGTVRLVCEGGVRAVVRDPHHAPRWARWLARRLAAREAAALETLGAMRGVPALLGFEDGVVRRSFLDGEPMHVAQPRSRLYFLRALRLLIAVHRRGVAHNDLAKEPNWICMPHDEPAIVDFQVATISRRRGRLFRMLAHADLRHLMKHKRTYLPDRLTARQLHMLEHPPLPTLLWRHTVKPVYLWITRGLLGWRERPGPGERAW